MGWISDTLEKLNPGQRIIVQQEGSSVSSNEKTVAYQTYYDNVEIVNRAVNMIVDDTSFIKVKVGDTTAGMTVAKGIKRATVERLLNVEPNPFQDVNTFKRNCLIDLIIDGNIFIYFDGVFLYHIPANKMVIIPDPKTYVEKYVFNGQQDYKPEEIIHVKDNSFTSIYRGISRLGPAARSMALLTSMRKFQDNFFKNGAIPGLVIKSPNTLSDKIKERMLLSWGQRYRPDAGGRRPLILDGGMELEDISKLNFKDLDFQGSIATNEVTILKAIGVPPIMMDSGNNANIRPNHRMYYLETILPIVYKINSALEHFFGFSITPDLANIPALQPELREQATYLATLVNAGIIDPNEARDELGKPPKPGHDDLRIPQNIAGSAADPSQGGRPKDQQQ